jgi:hypothetical protein
MRIIGPQTNTFVCRDARSLRPVQSSISVRMGPYYMGSVLLDPFYWIRFIGPGFIGPGFIGLDAKILRPYKQMICIILQNK